MDREPEALISLSPVEARTAAALFERLFPADENDPGAGKIGVVPYLDRALSGAYRDRVEDYRLGLAALESAARDRHGTSFAGCGQDAQEAMISALESGTLHGLLTPSPRSFFEMLLGHLQEGLFADPAYGGNRDKLGWRFLGHPGVWLENSAEECLSEEPVTKGGEIRSLKDAGYSLGSPTIMLDDIPGYDPQRSVDPPSGAADVVLVGVGGVGGLISPIFARAGLRVVALEAGPWRRARDFVPDELGSAYYCRGNMGEKYLGETPRWRKNAGEPTREATFSLGRMMNGVGGSVIHYGAWLRRYHQHHFEHLTHVRKRWGPDVLPEGSTLADWPVTYEDLEPYYTLLDDLVGVAGGEEDNPFIPRSKPYPMPPLRPSRVGEIFRRATEKMGLHPHPVPAGMNSEPYNGHPATTYTAWNLGFGSFDNEKWHPALTSVPEALATGNLDLKTHCRVVHILTDGEGHASGVEYVDAGGEPRVQMARTVILCGYTFENVRLMLLSGDERHPDGLGNNARQVGRHFMTKMFAHVDGFFPDVVFNRHTGPAAQTMVLDDFLSEDLDYASNEFVGGATLGVENQLLPIQISRQDLPPGVPAWGKGYKDHIREWQHFCTVRIQPDTLSYENNFLDLDPRYRDRSGMPLVRITYDLRENEQRLAAWMENRSEEILHEMGATKTWRGPRFTGVGSSHDLGGCRMGEDPASSVVDPELGVHDTPGLYVFGGAVFPTCPGVNPTHTLWALCYRAAERLSERLCRGEER
ncbi:MAG: gluconate 2-dehydrogenase subunit 3 family protein [Rubrobacter sp.]|nr:gluconate 2-dehydrogenase subunit 3 family protein [Rubrobacter sp.]